MIRFFLQKQTKKGAAFMSIHNMKNLSTEIHILIYRQKVVDFSENLNFNNKNKAYRNTKLIGSRIDSPIFVDIFSLIHFGLLT